MIVQTRLTFAFLVIAAASTFDVAFSGGFQLKDDYLDVLKLVDNRIDRGHAVSELLPRGHVRDEILSYVKRLEHLKQELENDFRHTERYEREIKKLVKEFDPILSEAEHMVRTKHTIKPTHPTTQTIEPTTRTITATNEPSTSPTTTVKPTTMVTTDAPTTQTVTVVSTTPTASVPTTARPDKQKALDKADEMIKRGEMVEKDWRREIETPLTTLKYLRGNLENTTDPAKIKSLESAILTSIENFEPKLEKAEDLINQMTTTAMPPTTSTEISTTKSDRQDVLDKADEIIKRGEVLDKIWRQEIDYSIASFRVLRRQLESMDDSTNASLLESEILKMAKDFEPRLERAESFFKHVTPNYESIKKPSTVRPMILAIRQSV